MKWIFHILTILLFVTCDATIPDFTGDWVQKNEEHNKISIQGADKQYNVKWGDSEYQAQLSSQKLVVEKPTKLQLKIAENGELVVGEKRFIKYENSNSYLIDQEIVKGSGNSYCLVTDIYQKNGNTFVVVDYTEVEKTTRDSETLIFINERVDLRTFLLLDETAILSGLDEEITLDVNNKKEIITYEMWHIKVEEGIVKELSQVYFP